MFFMFHSLVFSVHIFVIISLGTGLNNLEQIELTKRNSRSFRDDLRKAGSEFRIKKSMFQITQNRTDGNTNNLKLNVFDKMLSNEMLSIKQKIFETDLNPVTTVRRTKQNDAPTPTIEIQPRWSVVELFTKTYSNEDSEIEEDTESLQDTGIQEEAASKKDSELQEVDKENINDDNKFTLDNIQNEDSNIEHDQNKPIYNITANKILELRSLPLENGHYHDSPAECSHSKSKPDHHECTRTTATTPATYAPYSVYPASWYMQYQPYTIFGDNNDNFIAQNYYPPSDEVKVPRKSKRRKTTRQPEYYDSYYDNDKERREKDHVSSNHRHKDVIMNIDYDLVDAKKSKGKFKDHTSKNLLDDLNEIFHREIRKKCYCSETSSLFKNSYALYIYPVVHVFGYFHKKILLFM